MLRAIRKRKVDKEELRKIKEEYAKIKDFLIGFNATLGVNNE
jgi:hypothetical protein